MWDLYCPSDLEEHSRCLVAEALEKGGPRRTKVRGRWLLEDLASVS